MLWLGKTYLPLPNLNIFIYLFILLFYVILFIIYLITLLFIFYYFFYYSSFNYYIILYYYLFVCFYLLFIINIFLLNILLFICLLHIYIHIYIFFGFLPFSSANPTAYGSSQARGPIGAMAAGLYQSHSNTGSEPCLQTIPQLMEMPDP